MMDQVEALLSDLIPRYWAAGKSYLTIAFGCTGGRHRSVAAAVEMAKRLRIVDLDACRAVRRRLRADRVFARRMHVLQIVVVDDLPLPL